MLFTSCIAVSALCFRRLMKGWLLSKACRAASSARQTTDDSSRTSSSRLAHRSLDIGRGGPWWSVGLVGGGAGAPIIACCFRRHRCRGAAPRRARLKGCTVRRLRPSWAFAVRRRCAGGGLERGGPKGQQSLCEGLLVSCQVVFPRGVSTHCESSFDDCLPWYVYFVFPSVLLPLSTRFLGFGAFFGNTASYAGPTGVLES